MKWFMIRTKHFMYRVFTRPTEPSTMECLTNEVLSHVFFYRQMCLKFNLNFHSQC